MTAPAASADPPRVLVTGGGGLLGARLVRLLSEAGAAVAVFQRFGRSIPPEIPFLPGDVRDGEAVRRAVAGRDLVFHLAAAPLATSPAERETIDAEGTRQIAAACAVAGVRRLVVASTAEVYGDPAAVPLPEDAPCRPVTHVGKIRLLAEERVRRVHRETGLAATILRPTTLVAADRLHPILWSLFENVRRRRAQSMIGAGTGRIHLVDADDAARAFLAAAGDPEPLGVYNVAGPDAVPLREAIRGVYEAAGTEPRVRALAEPPHPMVGRVMFQTMCLEMLGTVLLRAEADFVLDIRRARERLGWAPRTGTAALLARAYHAHLERVTRSR